MSEKPSPLPYDRAREAYSTLQQERLLVDCNTYLPNVLKHFEYLQSMEITNPDDKPEDDRIKTLFPKTCG